ncbi:MAG: DNA gyrase subunit A, partial [Clostridia bacterium]|nr:DNA gyrase subunit A [Clostridia bacterium]
KLSNVMLENIEKNTVDFAPNFYEKRKEPLVLPTRIPTLLVNGSSGIAVGMATNIPPHNLTEVLDGAIAQIDDPEISVEELMEYIKGPDFPTKGSIMGKSGIRSAYATGKGKIIIRAKTEIEERKDGTSSIIVTELPYQVNKKLLVESIADMVKDKKIEGLSDIDDHSSDRVGIRLEIFLKRDANPQVILNQLFKYTRLQDSFSINMLAIKDGKPKTMGLKEILEQFIKFQEEIVTRRTRFDLEKAEARMHILEGLRIALSNIDEIINIIRNSYDDAKERLMARFGMSEIQAQSVLDMRLGQLQKLNGEKIETEYQELMAKCEEYRLLLSDHGKLMEKIKEELLEIRDKYGDERLTQLEPAIDFIDDEDLIEEEQCVITMTHFGYIKRIPSATYKVQHRGGRGISGLSTREEDFVENIFTCSSHDFILFFTNKGRMYKLKAYRIPESGRQAKGTAIVNLLPLESDEKITATIPINKFEEDKYLTMITKDGFVKKTGLDQYDTNRKGGIIAIGLREGDELIKVALTEEDHNIILATKNGMCIKFSQSDVRPMGRGATGVTGIRLRGGDYVIGGSVCDDDCKVLSVSENGYGKKTDIKEFKCQNRAGKGVTGYNITDKTGPLAGMLIIKESDDLMSITSDGVIIRMSTDEISELGRVTQGVRVMKIAEDVKVVAIASTAREDEEETEEN